MTTTDNHRRQQQQPDTTTGHRTQQQPDTTTGHNRTQPDTVIFQLLNELLIAIHNNKDKTKKGKEQKKYLTFSYLPNPTLSQCRTSPLRCTVLPPRSSYLSTKPSQKLGHGGVTVKLML